MKTGLRFAIAALCLAFAAPAAFAGRVAGDITATVSQIIDANNLLGGQVTMDQLGRGRFAYETDMPMTGRYVNWDGSGEFRFFAETPSRGSLAFTLGGLVFELDATAPTSTFDLALVDANPGYSMQDQIRLSGSPLKPVAGLPGVDVLYVSFQFTDNASYSVLDYPMPTYLPDLSRFPQSRVVITGWSFATFSYFEVTLQMQTVQPSVAEPTVSPASGPFVRQQPIVPAVMLPSGTPVLGIEGSINGVAIPAAYFGGCSPAPTALRMAFVCPDINANLMPGMNRVEWRVRLPDGGVTSKSVDWEIVQ